MATSSVEDGTNHKCPFAVSVLLIGGRWVAINAIKLSACPLQDRNSHGLQNYRYIETARLAQAILYILMFVCSEYQCDCRIIYGLRLITLVIYGSM